MLLTQQASWKKKKKKRPLEAAAVTSADGDQQHFHLVYSFADLGEKKTKKQQLHSSWAFWETSSISAVGASGSTELAFSLDGRIVMLFV